MNHGTTPNQQGGDMDAESEFLSRFLSELASGNSELGKWELGRMTRIKIGGLGTRRFHSELGSGNSLGSRIRELGNSEISLGLGRKRLGNERLGSGKLGTRRFPSDSEMGNSENGNLAAWKISLGTWKWELRSCFPLGKRNSDSIRGTRKCPRRTRRIPGPETRRKDSELGKHVPPCNKSLAHW